jgi:hypothetical protein
VVLGSFGYYGQDHTLNSLAFVTGVMGAQLLPEHVVITAGGDGDGNAAIASDNTQSQIRTAVTSLVRAIKDARQTAIQAVR